MVKQSRFNIYCFAFNLVDLFGVEETEILPNMSVNFKNFAVETRFIIAICSRAYITTLADIFHKDHKLIGSLSFIFPFNSLQWTDKYSRSSLDLDLPLICSRVT